MLTCLFQPSQRQVRFRLRSQNQLLAAIDFDDTSVFRNQADQSVYQTEKQMAEYKDKIPSEDEEQLRSALEELKEAAKSDDAERIRAAIEKHNTVWQKAAQTMYQSAGDGQQQTEQAHLRRGCGERHGRRRSPVPGARGGRLGGSTGRADAAQLPAGRSPPGRDPGID